MKMIAYNRNMEVVTVAVIPFSIVSFASLLEVWTRGLFCVSDRKLHVRKSTSRVFLGNVARDKVFLYTLS